MESLTSSLPALALVAHWSWFVAVEKENRGNVWGRVFCSGFGVALLLFGVGSRAQSLELLFAGAVSGLELKNRLSPEFLG
ncbi:hypothetical protein KY285_019512 [Solanum tuberosum]|nr:hypothetical protein KY285_019512 [Solanum tuberosum]